MDRKKFLSGGLKGLGVIVALPTVFASCNNDDDDSGSCKVSPSETNGPFPILTPSTVSAV